MIFTTPLPYYATAEAAAPAAEPTTKAAPAADPKPAGTALDDAAAGDDSDKQIVATGWPEDWRKQLAGEDKDALKMLERFKAPGDVGKSLVEARKRVSKGATDEPMPDPEKDADGAKAWREARGIPADPADYKVPESLKLSDADKPQVTAFTQLAHARNWSQKQVGEGLEMYFQFQGEAMERQAAADKEAAAATAEALRDEWGPDFRPNSKLAKAVMDAIAPGMNLQEARLPNGRRVGDVPELVKALAEKGREFFGDAAFAGGAATKATEDREAELKKMMTDDIDKWHANPKLAKELDEIRTAREKRGRAA